MRRVLSAVGVCLVLAAGAAPVDAATPTASWKVLAPPPVPLTADFFPRVSCVAAASCLVAWDYQPPTGPSTVAVASLTDGVWRRLPAPAGQQVIQSLSCTSLTNCEAVVSAVPYRWDGRTWTAQAFKPTSAGFNAVSCTSARNCVAVGYYANGSKLLIERWHSHAWHFQSILQPRLGGNLLSVSCASATACTAVGSTNLPGSGGLHLSRSVAYRLHRGERWTVSHPPDPADAIFGQLTNVTCPSAHVCVAPSWYHNSADNSQAFADVWQDGRWRMTQLPIPAASILKGESEIDSVDCLSPSTCVAVGSWLSADFLQHGALVEVWNGSAWRGRRGPVPLPAGATPGSGQLYGMSCGSATTCVSAGTYRVPQSGVSPHVMVEARQSVG